MKKIKICHVINAFENGGAEAVILNYVGHMDRSMFDFHVLAHGIVSQSCVNKFKQLGFTIHIIPSKKTPVGHVIEMYKVFRTEKFDILHIATTEWAFIAGFAGMVAGCKHRINHSHMAEIPNGIINTAFFRIKTYLGRLATNEYWACGTDAAHAIFGEKNVNCGNVKIYNNAIEIEKYAYDEVVRSHFRNDFGCSADTFVIGNIGRFSPQKNQLFLIDIFDKICMQYSDSCLVLVGEGPLKSVVQEKVHSMGLDSRVLFLGSRDDVNQIYQMLDLLLMPSIMEGLPLVGIEAQISGLKVLFSSAVTKEVNFTGNCEYVPLENTADAWAAHAISMRGNYRRLSHKCQDYDIAKQALIMRQDYLKIINSGL